MLSIRYNNRITKIKPFINKYNWEGIKFPSEKDDRKTFERNDWKISLNILYAYRAVKRNFAVIKRNDV